MAGANGKAASPFAGRRIRNYQRPLDAWLWHPALREGRFSLMDVPAMQQDNAVSIGLLAIYGPILNAKHEVRSPSREIKAFVERTLYRFWHHDLIKVLEQYVPYGTAVAETMYELDNAHGIWKYVGMDVFDTRDVQLFKRGRHLSRAVVSHGGAMMLPTMPDQHYGSHSNEITHPKVFCCAHRPEPTLLRGRSAFVAAWNPWMEKVGSHGALSIRKLWAFSNAFRGCWVRYPAGGQTIYNGVLVDNQDIAREIAEAYCTGAAGAIPGGTDELGKPLWEIIDPALNGEIKGLMEYPTGLNREIWQGMGVLDEVISAPDVGGWLGHNGPLSGPMLIFLNIEDLRVQEITTAFDVGPSGYTTRSEQAGGVIRPLVVENFGPRAAGEYQIIPISLIPKPKEPGAGGSPANAPAAAAPQTGMPSQPGPAPPNPAPPQMAPPVRLSQAESIGVELPDTDVATLLHEHELPSASPMDALRQHLREDEWYAWSWACNLACTAMDEGLDQAAAKRAAARFMKLAFDIDVQEPRGVDQDDALALSQQTSHWAIRHYAAVTRQSPELVLQSLIGSVSLSSGLFDDQHPRGDAGRFTHKPIKAEHVQAAQKAFKAGRLSVRHSKEPITSDASGEQIHHHVTLESGQRVHPDELHRLRVEDGESLLHHDEGLTIHDPSGKSSARSFADALHKASAFSGKHEEPVTIESKHGYSATRPRSEWMDHDHDGEQSFSAWYDVEGHEHTGRRVEHDGGATLAGEDDTERFFAPQSAGQGRLAFSGAGRDVSLSTDATGHEHKGKGPGGGQFTGYGDKGGDSSGDKSGSSEGKHTQKPAKKHGERAAALHAQHQAWKQARVDTFNEIKADAEQSQDEATRHAEQLIDAHHNLAWDPDADESFNALEEAVQSYDDDASASERFGALKDIEAAAKEAIRATQTVDPDADAHSDKINSLSKQRDKWSEEHSAIMKGWSALQEKGSSEEIKAYKEKYGARSAVLADSANAADAELRKLEEKEVGLGAKAVQENKQHLQAIVTHARAARQHIKAYVQHRKEMQAIKEGSPGDVQLSMAMPDDVDYIKLSAAWDEGKHRRGQPGNKGQFVTFASDHYNRGFLDGLAKRDPETDANEDYARGHGRGSERIKHMPAFATLPQTADEMHAKADEIAEYAGDEASTLFEQCAAPAKWLRDKTKAAQAALTEKYGAKNAAAIFAAGQVLTWGVTIAAPIVTGLPIFVPPGGGLLASLALAGLIEGYKSLRGKKTEAVASLSAADLSPEETQRLAVELVNDLLEGLHATFGVDDKDGHVSLSGARAPQGYSAEKPLVVQGKSYVGGQFIPGHVIEKATASEKAAIGVPDRPGKAPKAPDAKTPPSGDVAPRNQGESDKAYAKRVIDGLKVSSLPEDHGQYFNVEKATHTVPIAHIVSTKTDAENQQGGANAPARMWAASQGLLSKRDPITVRKVGEQYHVVDGNGTFTAAKALGWKSLPVQLESAQQPAQTDKPAKPAPPWDDDGSDVVKTHNSLKVPRNQMPNIAANHVHTFLGELPTRKESVPSVFTPEEHALPSDAKQPVEPNAGYAGLAEKGKEATHQLQKLLDLGKGIASQLGYETFIPKSDQDIIDRCEQPGSFVVIAPVKGEKRATEKVRSDYASPEHPEGDWSKLLDIARASLVVDSFDDVENVIKKMREAGTEIARKPKDRMTERLSPGYRDCMMNIRLPNGIIGEVQILCKAMMSAKASKTGHHNYEITRSIDAKMKSEGRKTMTPEEKTTYDKAMGEMEALYDAAWQKSKGSNPAFG